MKIKSISLLTLSITLSGCTAIPVVSSISEIGSCEFIDYVYAVGANEAQVRAGLEKAALKAGGNKLLFNARSALEYTPPRTDKSYRGTGSAYRCE